MENAEAAVEKPETDVDLPRALVKRLVKNKLAALAGDDGKEFGISKDALTALSESTKVFISLIASTANDICQEKRRSTVNADDVFNALQDLDFPELVGPLREQLEAFKEAVKERNKNRPSKKRKNAPEGGAAQRNAKQQQAAAAAAAAAAAEADVGAAAAIPDVHGVDADADAGADLVEAAVGGGLPGVDDVGDVHGDAAAGLDGDVTADVLGGDGDDDGLEGLGLGLGVGMGVDDGDTGGLDDPTGVGVGGVEVEDMLVDAPP